MEAVIENIKKYLKELGLTQRELAHRSGLTVETINRVLNEKQKLLPNTLEKIANGLGVSVSDLKEEKNNSFSNEVQGYLQFGKEITQITSFKSLQKWIDKYQKLIDLPKQAKAILKEEAKNAQKAERKTTSIDKETIDFYKEEVIDASTVEIYSFNSKEDKRNGISLDLGNMSTTFQFTFNNRLFSNSEALYICALFSNNTQTHIDIQERLKAEINGLRAKKFVRARFEEKCGRKDFHSFNVEFLKFSVWQKIIGNNDFRNLLLKLPKNALIVEDSSGKSGENATFWGMENDVLKSKRKIIEDYTVYNNPTLSKKKLNEKVIEECNKINHIGVWKGVNCMGKILKYLQLCLLDGVEPVIDYNLLRSKKIYLFGELLTFENI